MSEKTLGKYEIESHRIKGTPSTVHGGEWSYKMVPCKWNDAEYFSVKNGQGQTWLWIAVHGDDEFYFGKTPEKTSKGPYRNLEDVMTAAVK